MSNFVASKCVAIVRNMTKKVFHLILAPRCRHNKIHTQCVFLTYVYINKRTRTRARLYVCSIQIHCVSRITCVAQNMNGSGAYTYLYMIHLLHALAV